MSSLGETRHSTTLSLGCITTVSRPLRVGGVAPGSRRKPDFENLTSKSHCGIALNHVHRSNCLGKQSIKQPFKQRGSRYRRSRSHGVNIKTIVNVYFIEIIVNVCCIEVIANVCIEVIVKFKTIVNVYIVEVITRTSRPSRPSRGQVEVGNL